LSDEAPPKLPLYDYDKLIEESEGLYKQWWIRWKDQHPEWGIQKEEPKEPVITPLLKRKVIFKKLSCKRCKAKWIPRKKQPPIQCPKCKSSYWNKDKKKV
jgi:DNA-directed RNA polymerase subunit RPC12/RpoP